MSAALAGHRPGNRPGEGPDDSPDEDPSDGLDLRSDDGSGKGLGNNPGNQSSASAKRNKCPIRSCNDLVPATITGRLHHLLTEKKKKKPKTTPQHEWDRRLESINQEICQRISSDAVREEGLRAGYPSLIDYNGLAIRTLRLKPFLDSVIEKGALVPTADELIKVANSARAGCEPGERPFFTITMLNKETRGSGFYMQYACIKHIISPG